MQRAWLAALLCLAACGDNLQPPPVASADVSILYPLPATIDPLIRPDEQAAYGQLFPQKLFPTSIGPVDTGTGYGDMRLIALRLDPCSARGGCSSEVRVIYQPVVVGNDGGLTVGDGAIHVFYAMPRRELVTFLREILELKKKYGDGISYGNSLGVQPILAATGLDGDFARGLHALILEHLGESRIQRFTERNHQVPGQDRWDFYLFERVGSDLVRKNIEATPDIELQVTGTPPDPSVAGGIVGVAPMLDSPELAVVDVNRPPDATDAIRTGFARAIALQDPNKATSESVDCVSCHLAEAARYVGVTEYGLTPTGAFHSQRSLEYRRDLRAVTDLHMFAYDGRAVSVMQRVTNESAVTADAFEQLLATSP